MIALLKFMKYNFGSTTPLSIRIFTEESGFTSGTLCGRCPPSPPLIFGLRNG
jgi:hypothetical protein